MSPSTVRTTEKMKPNTHQEIKPLPKDTATVDFELVINMKFDNALNNKSSIKYLNLSRDAKNALQTKFRSETGDQTLKVNITGFKKGSLIVSYEVITPLTGKPDRDLITLTKSIYTAATEWKKGILNRTVDMKRTREFNLKRRSLIQNFCDCPSEEYVCVNSANVSIVCQHICNASNYECGEHGVCIYDVISKKPTCHCKLQGSRIYYGEHCDVSYLMDSLPSKQKILVIAGGVGGALLLIILISSVCFCRYSKHRKDKHGSFSESSSNCDSVSPWEHRKRENIPLKAGQLNPISDPDSQRYVYVENNKGSPRLWKQIEDQELGGNTLIYQPSNTSRPVNRGSLNAEGDLVSMRTAPSMGDRRSSFYSTIDTENQYKIQRPYIKHNNLYS
ncbi:uncharacterized protein LOC111127483 [Crassostrea virginica]